MELLVEKIISSAGMPLSPGDSLRRVMEAASSGLLTNGPGILDPCEKEPHDALAGLSKQQREDLCVSSQEFLRLIAFRQIYKVISILVNEKKGKFSLIMSGCARFWEWNHCQLLNSNNGHGVLLVNVDVQRMRLETMKVKIFFC